MRRRINLVARNIVAQGLGTAIALAFTVAGARLLSIADYGELRYVMTLLPLLMAFSLPGFDSVILRRTSMREQVPLVRIFHTRIATGCIGSTLILITLLILGSKINDTLSFLLLTTAALLPLFETATGYRNYLLGRGLQQRGTDLLLQSRIVGLVLFVFFLSGILVADIDVLWIYPGWVVSNILSTITAFSRVAFRRQSVCSRERSRRSRVAVSEAAVTTGAGLIYTFAFALDKLWVRHELGADQLALYALLVMVPQELARLLDSTIPLFYRGLFFGKQPHAVTKFRGLLLFLPLTMIGYALSFFALSGYIFGESYTYPLSLVLLSSLMIGSLSVEYFSNHRIFAQFGARGMFAYSLCSVVATTLAVTIGLALGGIAGLIAGLVVKQLTLPSVFLFISRKTVYAV